MRLGAQMSAAGGVFKAFARADEVGCETVMVYTKSNRQWRAKPLDEKVIGKYKQEAEKYAGQVDPLVVHAAYLINVASPKPDLWAKSRDALRDEIERVEALGAELMVLHPGSHVGEGEAAGLERIAKALNEVIGDTAGFKMKICLETMAGQGTNLGAKFEHFEYLLNAMQSPERVAVCFDTCHVFAAGYDIRSAESYAATMHEFDRIVGLDQIKCFHFNDSKFELGKRKDRHAHIGQGFIGTEGFANFVNDPRWANHPAHIETPKTEKNEDGTKVEMDAVNLETLRRLRL